MGSNEDHPYGTTMEKLTFALKELRFQLKGATELIADTHEHTGLFTKKCDTYFPLYLCPY